MVCSTLSIYTASRLRLEYTGKMQQCGFSTSVAWFTTSARLSSGPSRTTQLPITRANFVQFPLLVDRSGRLRCARPRPLTVKANGPTGLKWMACQTCLARSNLITLRIGELLVHSPGYFVDHDSGAAPLSRTKQVWYSEHGR